MRFGPAGLPAPVIGEHVTRATGKPDLFAVIPRDPLGNSLQICPEIPACLCISSTDPDMLVVVADRNSLAGCGPSGPCAMHCGQVILRPVLPVQNRGPLISDHNLIVRREAVVIGARSEKAIVAKKFGVIEQLRFGLLPGGGRSARHCDNQRPH